MNQGVKFGEKTKGRKSRKTVQLTLAAFKVNFDPIKGR
jgi:hypothetical protein